MGVVGKLVKERARQFFSHICNPPKKADNHAEIISVND